MHRDCRRSQVAVALSGLLLVSLTLFGPGVGAVAADEHHAVGHVYVLDNNLSGANSITVFAQAADGALSNPGTTDIGGLGSVSVFADGTHGSLIRTWDGERERLFAVDAGSNQISVVDVKEGKLSLVGVFASGGAGPISLTYQDGLLYVLNAANTSMTAANVAGFRVDEDGPLPPIAGATRPLSTAHPNPVQVQLDPQRRFLLVTEKGTEKGTDIGRLDAYRVASDGSLSGPSIDPTVGAIPFGMAFAHHSWMPELVVSVAAGGSNGTGAATAYRLEETDG